jgi:hypothetical protein
MLGDTDGKQPCHDGVLMRVELSGFETEPMTAAFQACHLRPQYH